MSDPRTLLPWGAEALWRQLSPQLPGLSVEVLGRCESTSTTLVDRCRTAAGSRAGDGDGDGGTRRGRRNDDLLPCLLVAETQTHGRGRLGRDWMAVTGGSLTFSLVLPLSPRGPDGWSGLSLAVGCTLADALEAVEPVAAVGAGTVPPRIGLKWPNDLWLRDGRPGHGRKLGGILIETVPVGDRRMVVVGVGLNVQPIEDAGGALEHGMASLSELVPDLTAPQALARVALPLVQALQRFEAAGFAPFIDAYARRDLLAGQAVVTRGTEPPVAGICEGVQPDGALRLRQSDGTLSRLVSGEVSVRLTASPTPAQGPAAC